MTTDSRLGADCVDCWKDDRSGSCTRQVCTGKCNPAQAPNLTTFAGLGAPPAEPLHLDVDLGARPAVTVERALPRMHEQGPWGGDPAPLPVVPSPISQGRLMVSDFLVYLAGPISGLNYDGAEDWRRAAKVDLGAHGIKAVSPLRGKDYLRGFAALTADCAGYGDLNCMSSPRGIMTRDRYDAMRCDCLLVNLLGAGRVSIGTVMEIAWADARRTPIVVAMEPAGNLHEHAMIAEAIGFRVASLPEALHVVKAIADNGPVRR